MSKNAPDSGRIETFLAAIILVAVLGLFVKFKGTEPIPEPPTKVEATAQE